jgi:hypothetical protein
MLAPKVAVRDNHSCRFGHGHFGNGHRRRGVPDSVRAVVILLLLAGRAEATCDGCCDLDRQLVGWSADGIAVIERWDRTPQRSLVVEQRGQRTRRWSSYRDDEQAMCVPDQPRVRDVRRLDSGLPHVGAAWRTAFAARVKVAPVGMRRGKHRDFGTWECEAWELRDGARVVARFPRQCEGGIPLGSVRILGGYLQGDAALVKVEIRRVGYRTEEAFIPVSLAGTR